ncbi:type II toxin-antitoxin system RelE/ParE family toxin [Psychrobacter sp. TB55-MNA-CIBAN-0194]|uniref:type II toxin-antitoxin system RelE/ParE family toxin n=1 Tax=Psychrobacter sp. TB55-MNA-CIBAN-0194 TaxID=3140445 RepID=UPI003320BDB7
MVGYNQLKQFKQLFLDIQHYGKPCRAFYVFDPYRQAVMLCGGDRTGDKRFYERMMPIAESIYQACLETLDNKENKK